MNTSTSLGAKRQGNRRNHPIYSGSAAPKYEFHEEEVPIQNADQPETRPQRRPPRKKFRVNGVRLSIFAAVCYTVVSLVGQQLQVHELNQELQQLETAIQQEQFTNQALKERVQLLEGDEAYVELVARDKLGMVRQGEIQYIFKDR